MHFHVPHRQHIFTTQLFQMTETRFPSGSGDGSRHEDDGIATVST